MTLTRNLPVVGGAINALRAASWAGGSVSDLDWGPVLARGLGWVCAAWEKP